MLKVSDLKIDAAKTVGSPLVLCRTQPTMAYEEGVRTTKRDDQHRHGFGVKSIRHIAQQYGGEVTIRTNDHWFVLTVLLPRQTGLMAM